MQDALKNLLVIDLETSGTNPFRHQVLAIGMVPLVREHAPLNVFVRHADVEWTEYARRNFENFSDAWQAEAMSPSDACMQIESYIRDAFDGQCVTPVGHNVGFDQAFLRKLADQGGRVAIEGLSHRAIDTHTLLLAEVLKGSLPSAALTSDGAFAEFGIVIPARQRHTAVGDALATRELVRALLAVKKRPGAAAASTIRLRPRGAKANIARSDTTRHRQ